MSDPTARAQQLITRHQVTVAYDDGNADTVVLKPVALVMAERHYKGNVPPIEGTLYAAWWLLGKEQRRELPPFADWLESIAGIDERAADPFQAPPAAPSQTSP